jgi:hypothetical protein
MLTLGSQPLFVGEACFPVLSCGGLNYLYGAGHASGISGLEDAIPVLGERTRQLIARLVEASVQSALAATRNGPSGDEGGGAEKTPLAGSEATPDPIAAEIREGAGGSSEVQARGEKGPGDIERSPGTDEGEDGGAGERNEAAEGNEADEADSAGGPQAFSQGGTKRGEGGA